MTFEPGSVRAFEHAGWQRAAEHYATTFAPATAGFVGDLLDAARVGPGLHVLDLACGPGLVAAVAADRGALPVGVDFSAAMIAMARAGHPGISFEDGDGEALPFADSSFDVVVANFGIHHFTEPVNALREAYRVLRPGGRLAFTTWAAPAENIAWLLLFDAIAAHGDMAAAKTPPPGGSLLNPADVLGLLETAGFCESEAQTMQGEWCLDSPADLVEGFRRGTVRTAALLNAQPAAALPGIEAAVARKASAYRRGDGYAVPIAAILGSGTRPQHP